MTELEQLKKELAELTRLNHDQAAIIYNQAGEWRCAKEELADERQKRQAAEKACAEMRDFIQQCAGFEMASYHGEALESLADYVKANAGTLLARAKELGL